MKIFKRVNLVLLTLLGITAGIAKIMKVPEEMEFFQGVGFSENLLVLFGATQLIGGALLIFRQTRTAGATIVAVTFCISTIAIFMAGNIGFGFFSILPILMAGIVIKDGIKIS